MRKSAINRILPRLEDDENGCWIWTGNKGRGGYGQVYNPGGTTYVHRIVYEFFWSPIPEGLTLDHLCRVPACANPLHMEPVTLSENVKRGVNTGWARKARQTHCMHGHEFDEKNTYIRRNGTRACRTCIARRKREAA